MQMFGDAIIRAVGETEGDANPSCNMRLGLEVEWNALRRMMSHVSKLTTTIGQLGRHIILPFHWWTWLTVRGGQ